MNSKTPLDPFLALFIDPSGGTVCAVQLSAVENPGAWGIVLGDIIQHIVNAYTRRGHHPDRIRAEVLQTLALELAHPSEKAVGQEMEWTPDGLLPYGAGEGEA